MVADGGAGGGIGSEMRFGDFLLPPAFLSPLLLLFSGHVCMLVSVACPEPATLVENGSRGHSPSEALAASTQCCSAPGASQRERGYGSWLFGDRVGVLQAEGLRGGCSGFPIQGSSPEGWWIACCGHREAERRLWQGGGPTLGGAAERPDAGAFWNGGDL